MRKGQVLEIAGKRAVVQVCILEFSDLEYHRFSKEHQELTTYTLTVSSQVMSCVCPSVLKCLVDHSMDQETPSITALQYSLRSS